MKPKKTLTELALAYGTAALKWEKCWDAVNQRIDMKWAGSVQRAHDKAKKARDALLDAALEMARKEK